MSAKETQKLIREGLKNIGLGPTIVDFLTLNSELKGRLNMRGALEAYIFSFLHENLAIREKFKTYLIEQELVVEGNHILNAIPVEIMISILDLEKSTAQDLRDLMQFIGHHQSPYQWLRKQIRNQFYTTTTCDAKFIDFKPEKII